MPFPPLNGPKYHCHFVENVFVKIVIKDNFAIFSNFHGKFIFSRQRDAVFSPVFFHSGTRSRRWEESHVSSRCRNEHKHESTTKSKMINDTFPRGWRPTTLVNSVALEMRWWWRRFCPSSFQFRGSSTRSQTTMIVPQKMKHRNPFVAHPPLNVPPALPFPCCRYPPTNSLAVVATRAFSDFCPSAASLLGQSLNSVCFLRFALKVTTRSLWNVLSGGLPIFLSD